MRKLLKERLTDLDLRIGALDAQREADDSLEVATLLEQLRRERNDVADALRDATLIDNTPFDTEAIEVGDTVTIQDQDGSTDRYVLVDQNMRTRARSNWVSVSSPLGAALLGSSKGDDIVVASPSGLMSYVIVDFERSSDESAVPVVPAQVNPPEHLSRARSDSFRD